MNHEFYMALTVCLLLTAPAVSDGNRTAGLDTLAFNAAPYGNLYYSVHTFGQCV